MAAQGQGRGEDGNAGLLFVAFSVILVRLGGAQQYIGIRPAEGLQPLGHQSCKGNGTGIAQVCVVGLALRVVRVEPGRKYHVQFAAGRLTELLHQLGAGGSQVNERQRLPRSKLTDCIGVGTVGRRQAFAWLGWGTGGILVNMAFRASGVATLDTTISKITAVK